MAFLEIFPEQVCVYNMAKSIRQREGKEPQYQRCILNVLEYSSDATKIFRLKFVNGEVTVDKIYQVSSMKLHEMLLNNLLYNLQTSSNFLI